MVIKKYAAWCGATVHAMQGVVQQRCDGALRRLWVVVTLRSLHTNAFIFTVIFYFFFRLSIIGVLYEYPSKSEETIVLPASDRRTSVLGRVVISYPTCLLQLCRMVHMSFAAALAGSD